MASTSTWGGLYTHWSEQTTIPPFATTPYIIEATAPLPALPTSVTVFAFINDTGMDLVETVAALSVVTTSSGTLVVSEVVSVELLNTAGPFTWSTNSDGTSYRNYVWTATHALEAISTLGVQETLGTAFATPPVRTTTAFRPTSALPPSTAFGGSPQASYTTESSPRSRLAIKIAVPMAVGLVILLACIGVLLYLLRQRPKRHGKSHRSNSNVHRPPESPPKFESSAMFASQPPSYTSGPQSPSQEIKPPSAVQSHEYYLGRSLNELPDEESSAMRPSALSRASR